MNSKSRLVLIATLLVSGTATALPARTALWEASITRTETVRYMATQASTAEGAAALYANLRDASQRVCTEGQAFALDATGLDACVATALESAVRQVAIPMVTVLHLQAGKSATVASR